MTEKVGQRFEDSRVISSGLAEHVPSRKRKNVSLSPVWGRDLCQHSVNQVVISDGFGKYTIDFRKHITDLSKRGQCSRVGTSKGYKDNITRERGTETCTLEWAM